MTCNRAGRLPLGSRRCLPLVVQLEAADDQPDWKTAWSCPWRTADRNASCRPRSTNRPSRAMVQLRLHMCSTPPPTTQPTRVLLSDFGHDGMASIMHGVLHAAESNAAGRVDHRVADCQAEACCATVAQPANLDSRPPVYPGSLSVGRCALGDEPGPIGLKTEYEVAALPVVADLTAADEAGLVASIVLAKPPWDRRGCA